MKYAAVEPKSKKSNKRELKTYKGKYTGRILSSLHEDRQNRNDNHVWSGFLSPSNQLAWDMCMDDVYDRMCEPYEMDENGEVITFLGRMIHEGFKNQSKWIKGFHYDFRNNLTPGQEEWQKKCWPECVGRDNVSGWVYKADNVMQSDYLPGAADIVDLKSSYQNPLNWEQFTSMNLPREKDIVQVSVYGDRMKACGLLPEIGLVGLDYFNVTNHLLVRGIIQNAEYYWPFELIEYEVRNLVYHGARHRRFKLLGERRNCTFEHCKKHGSEESKAMYKIKSFLNRSKRHEQ